MLQALMEAKVFPARAGMSPFLDSTCPAQGGVPRASGDEPKLWRRILQENLCSPRERG